MKLDLKVVPDLATLMAEEIEAAERAVTTGVGEVGVRLKGNWRAQVVGAGLGPRLGNTIRSERYPKQGSSIRAAALVWSKAPAIVGAHDRGQDDPAEVGPLARHTVAGRAGAHPARSADAGDLGAQDGHQPANDPAALWPEPARCGQRADH
ncbi:DUF6441 family protein [Acuticoccus sp. I52.16.1]|uniref:DUF6441 family protein n=1 Tax=Acuticoccus sp. I52.16.1 TaxID=2928472 RepID=UPI00352FA58B